MARLEWYSDPPSPHQLKQVVKVGPPLTKLSGSAHEIFVLADTFVSLDSSTEYQHYLACAGYSLVYEIQIGPK